MDASRLPEARLRFPRLADDEVQAMRRLRQAITTGDVASGSQALADCIDAQAAMLVYISFDGMTTTH